MGYIVSSSITFSTVFPFYFVINNLFSLLLLSRYNNCYISMIVFLFIFLMVVKLISSLTLSWEASRIPESPCANSSSCIPHSDPMWASPAHRTVQWVTQSIH